MNLSHSQIQKYLQCSEKWRLHYQEGLRTEWLTSSLFFGSAIDSALSRLLLTKKKNLTEIEKEEMKVSVIDTFVAKLSFIELNGQDIDIKNYNKVKYFKSDLEPSFFDKQQLSRLYSIYEDIKNKEYNQLDINDFNLSCWDSLYRKGLILIEEYEKQIMPQILEVISIQEEVLLPDGNGNNVVGKIDFRAIFADEPETIVTVDNKTSSSSYSNKMVQESPQLSIYTEFTGDKKAAFICIPKKLNVRSPRVNIKIFRAEIPKTTTDQVFEEINHTLEGIQEGKFEKNMNACFSFGTLCEYFSLCKYNTPKDLFRVDKKPEIKDTVNILKAKE